MREESNEKFKFPSLRAGKGKVSPVNIFNIDDDETMICNAHTK